jgi:peroxiredoxin
MGVALSSSFAQGLGLYGSVLDDREGNNLVAAAHLFGRYGSLFSMQRLALRRTASGLVAGVLASWFLASTATTAGAAAPQLDGQEAPDFVLRTLDQSNLRLSEFRGQVVLINFWASWCGACRQAMPAFNEIHEKYRRAGLVMLSINLDDEAHRAMHMAQSLKIQYPVLLDERKVVSRLYQVETMPLTVLIDREGKVRFVQVGYNAGDEKKFAAPLRSMLNE